MKLDMTFSLKALITSIKVGLVSLMFLIATEIYDVYVSLLSAYSKRMHVKAAIVYSCVSHRYLIDKAIGKDVGASFQLYPFCLPDHLLKIFVRKPAGLQARFDKLWAN